MPEANARRSVPDGPPGARGPKRPIRRSSNNRHLHLAVVAAIAVSSAIAIAIPITRTEAGPNSASTANVIVPPASDSADALRIQAAGVTATLASGQAGKAVDPVAAVQPPLGAGLFPSTLLTEAARISLRDAFPPAGSQAAIAITRSTPVSFTVHEDGFATSYSSNQMTVGLALKSVGISANEGDLVLPSADSALTPGAHIYVRYATDVRLVVAGQERSVKTHAQTVSDVLVEAGIAIERLDRVTPRRARPIKDGMLIKVTTVRDVVEATEETIPYSSVVEYDAELAEGNEELTQGGWDGVLRREYKVRRVNGREVRRVLIGEALTPPQTEIITVGTYVAPAAPRPAAVAAAVATPAPEPGCSRTLNVYATWYTAASAGGSGVTATGTGVYKGIVAVDPRVIPLGTQMYIPGYGYGIAADTGGAIKGNIIDLGYGANDVKDWNSRFLDICIV